MTGGEVIKAKNDTAVLYLTTGKEKLCADGTNVIIKGNDAQHLEEPIIGKNFCVVIQEEHEGCLHMFYCAIDEVGKVKGVCGNIESSYDFLF